MSSASVNAASRLGRLLQRVNRVPTVKLDKIRAVNMTVSSRGPGHSGARAFVREVSPALRLQNPSLAFTTRRDATHRHMATEGESKEAAATAQATLRATTRPTASLLAVRFADGSTKQIDVTRLSSEEILERIQKLDAAQA
jgi:hypothetical protein